MEDSMKKIIILTITVFLFLIAFTNCPTTGPGGYSGHVPTHLYYAEQGNRQISRASLDNSSDMEVIVTLPAFYSVYEIVLDGVNNMMYFTDSSNDKIYRFSLDNTADIQEFANPAGTPAAGKYLFDGIDIDTVNNQIYWIYRQTGDTDYIQRLNIDQSGAIENVITVSDASGDIKGFDVSGSLDKIIYCVDSASDHVYVSNIAGDSITEIFTDYIYVGMGDFEIDEKNSKIFYISGVTGLESSNFDGSNKIGIGTPTSNPGTIAYDASKNQVYWSEYTTDDIFKSHLVATHREDFRIDLNIPRGICLY
jgi:hypothetical protein